VSRRQDRTFLAVVVGVAILWWIPQRAGPIDLRSDGAVYYILGTSLAQGQGYRLLNEPGDIRAVQYPPLLPLIVAAHQKALATTDFVVVGKWLRAFYFCVSVTLMAAVYRLARHFLPPWRALLGGVICALAFHIWFLAGALYTEIPFALIAVVFILCARRADRRGFWLATAALGVAGYLLRTAGIALLVAWVAEALIHRPSPGERDDHASLGPRFREAAARSIAALLPVIAWQAYIVSVTASPEYRHPAYSYQRAPYQYSNVTYRENISLVSPFAPEQGHMTAPRLVSRLTRNVAFILPSLGGALTAQQAFWDVAVRDVNRYLARDALPIQVALIPMTAIGLVVLAGALVMVRRRQYLMPLCCGAAAVMTCVTPWPEQFARYFAPMIPFLSIMLMAALGAALDAAPTTDVHSPRGLAWAGRGLSVAVLTVVLAQDAYVAWLALRFNPARPVTYVDTAGRATRGQLLFYEAEAAAMDEALEEVRRRAQPGDVVATSMPHWAYLRTGVKSILPPLEADPDYARRLLNGVPIRFVVLDELRYPRISQRYAAPAVEGHPEAWRRIYQTRDGQARLYEHLP
jgi:hypothetical protein